MQTRGIVVLGALALAAPSLAPSSRPQLLHARMSGKAELGLGAPAGKGTARIKLDPGHSRLCWVFTAVGGIDRASDAGIHRGRTGTRRPVALRLGRTFFAAGCVIASKRTIAAIGARPNEFYVEIRTALYPRGAIRGQLVAER